ncbi:hypothetical protein E1H12_16265 [Geitlerinema sp. P-1104]|uniref:Mov34/MPN/PAD-1 family protein n=1 Tax=Geitlerinema sp. P-1104 TaxID=2546230 RepID=UPI00147691E0|nr:Mov34/MPN/PAD-1 family protein [Geitlerinema sp. P-1104]NMG60029.1 hypothetical protein [Geitlerinema sp. P-1104]
MVKLRWKESKDVYQPTQKNLKKFIQEKQQLIFEYTKFKSLYNQKLSQSMIVFVEREAESRLIQHLSVDCYTETGGIVVGKAYFCPETGRYYTEIVGSIAATHTVGNAVHFQFTPQCWSSILKNQKLYYPESTIVGWYHSHPGHGIFLSGTDLNTQRLSFSKIWQIAVVFDPQRREIGYFYGANGIRLEPIYLSNSSGSEPLKWYEDSQQTQPREEPPQSGTREVTLPPVPPSQPVQNEITFLPPTPDRLERNTEREENSFQNRLLIFLVIVVALPSLSLLTMLINEISENHPQNTPKPKYQTEPKVPDPQATQETTPIESQTPESDQLESSESESQSQEPKP